jgi:N-acetylglucosaminyl-diphospho-decaprenol L-rhamnosyltransferase
MALNTMTAEASNAMPAQKVYPTSATADLTSVIMVSYQTGPVLFEAITSVLAQTKPVELCLVDNGNPPAVVAQLQAMARKDSRIQFLSGHGNIGFSKGCNLGAHHSEGDYLLFLNPDGKIPAAALEELKQHAATLRHPFMIGARLLDKNGKDQRGCRRALLTPTTAIIEALHLGNWFPHMRLNFNDHALPPHIMPMPAISGAFMFLSRDDFWHVGGFDEDYFLHVEDLDLCLRFRRAGGEIYFVPDLVVTHIGGSSQVTTFFVESFKATSLTRYFHKNFGGEYPGFFLFFLDIAIWARLIFKIGLLAIKTITPK